MATEVQARIVNPTTGFADPNLYTLKQAEDIVSRLATTGAPAEGELRVQTRIKHQGRWGSWVVQNPKSTGLVSFQFAKATDSRRPVTVVVSITDRYGDGVATELTEHQLALLLAGSVVPVDVETVS